MKAAIHQADFFPWAGFFNKYYNSDLFIIHDYGQYPKGASDYTSRVKVMVSGTSKWLKIPVRHDYHGFRSYAETEIDNSKPWRKKMIQTLRLNYCHHPFFREIFNVIEPLIQFSTDSLFEFNMQALRSLIELFHLDTGKLIMGSSLKPTGAVKSDMIIELVKCSGASVYLSGTGAGGYMDEAKIIGEGIELAYNSYQPVPYPQYGREQFEPGLSIIDCLFNVGAEKAKTVLTGETI